MKEYVFLNKNHILRLHQLSLEDYGGASGIRDEDLLDSAIFQPEATFGGEFLHESIFHMAAAYFFHISQNQPFNDGNKRTGTLAMIAFLKANGYDLNVSDDALYPILIEVAEGRLSKNGFSIFIEQHANLTVE
jgi:death-on-curing protein